MSILKNNKSFRQLLFFSITLLSINQFFQLELIKLSTLTSNQSTSLGNAMTLLTISKILALPISAYFVDLFQEKKVLLFSSIGFVIFFIFVLLQNSFFTFSTNRLFLYAIISGILLGIVQPSMYSIIPKIIDLEKSTEANSLFQTSSQLSQFIIPTIAAFFIAYLSRSIYYLFIIFLSFLSLVFSKKIVLHNSPEKIPKNKEKNIPSSFKVIFQSKKILSLLILTAMINFSTSGPLQVTLPVFINAELNHNTSIYGFFMSIYGFGSFLGSLFSMTIKKKYESLNFLLFLSFCFGVVWTTIIRNNNNTLTVGFLLFISGCLIGIINVLFMSILQIKTPKNLLSKVTSIQFFFSTLLTPLSFFIMGKLTSNYSPSLIYTSSGLLIILSTIFLYFFNYKSDSRFRRSKITKES